MMVHGYAQRTSNEWPGVGLSVPAWLSDYSNGLMVESGGNMVRWMHVTPWKQDGGNTKSELRIVEVEFLKAL